MMTRFFDRKILQKFILHGGGSSTASVNKLLKEGHAESPNGFVISPKSIIVKFCDSFNVSNFTHNQKILNKNNLCLYFKGRLFIYKVKEFSFYF